MSFNLDDTIVAIATPPGVGGVGIVRLSGNQALIIAQKVFISKTKNWKHQQMVYGCVQDAKKQIIDDGLCVYFQSPHSFTGEDVVEIQIHGSPFTLNQTVSLCIDHGARLAGPGEFTKRAFLNEKMDLIQAEAVSELIHAQSIKEASLSRKRLDGKLSSHIDELRNVVIEVLAELDADVDFPEEDLPLARKELLLEKMKRALSYAQDIYQTYRQNETIRDGFRLVLVGSPNAGKSSFFNQLLQLDRAIVTDVEGTTRDTITEDIFIQGRRVKLIDTAGLRETSDDVIELKGMDRTREEIELADLVCVIKDAQKGMHTNLQKIVQDIPLDKKWLIENKIDLIQNPIKQSLDFKEHVEISCLTQQGLDAFKCLLEKKLLDEATEDFGGGISNDRQRSLMKETIEFLQISMQALQKEDSPELIAFEFRRAFASLNHLLGKNDGYEDIFDHIFSTFCVGK